MRCWKLWMMTSIDEHICIFVPQLKISRVYHLQNHPLTKYPFIYSYMILKCYDDGNQLKSSLLSNAVIFSCSSAIAFFLSAISVLIISSVGSFLFFFYSSGLFLMPSSLISSLRLLISFIRSTFSFIMRIFSCLWISESFWRFFLSILIDFSRYFFWFLYYCSISESILTCVMVWLQNLFLSYVAWVTSYCSFWMSWVVWYRASLKDFIRLLWKEMRARWFAIFPLSCSSFLKRTATNYARAVLSEFRFVSCLSILFVWAFILAISCSLGAMSFLSYLILWSRTYLNFYNYWDFFLSS